ncbi:MAG: hypothetical protein ACTSXE_02850 [Candidatus Thorarchaeota archaeon]
MTISDSLPVIVWITPEESVKGALTFVREAVLIELKSGQIIHGKASDRVFFELQNMISLDNNGQSSIAPIESKHKVRLKPNLIISQPYSDRGRQFIEDVFPPSTSGFYGRLQAGKEEATYFVHQIEDSDRFFLSITDSFSGRIYETHIIQPYEAEALSLVDDIRIRERLYTRSLVNREQSRDDILSILDTPTPSWKDLARIIREVSVPNLKLGNTMRDTLSQIVPDSFPEKIREELMAFLAYVVKSKIPEEDPLTYSFKFSSIPIMESLLNGHLMCLMDNTEWPPYVKLMTLAARGQLEAPKKAVSSSILSAPWLLYGQKCMEYRPSWLHIAVNSAKKLNKSGNVVLGLPTTETAARSSRAAWKRRFAEISHGLRIRGHIDSSSLGLVELVYLGAAYRWSHHHMKFISRLGSASENSPHLQVMIMPVSAAERLKRTLPTILSVHWSARTSNLYLYDEKSDQWIVPVDRIISSVEEKSSMKKLKKQFSENGVPEVYPISKEEARVADLLSEGVESLYLEIPEFLSNWGLSKKKIHTTLSNMINRNVMRLTYEVADMKLVSLAIIIQGRNETVTSVVYELLRSTPTSYARLNEAGESGVILTRLPEESVYDIASQLASRGIEHDVNIRCMRPTTFRRYTSNLYQRLLKEDGTWDDDVSAFLSQARSKRKQLSKSNA